MLKVIQDQRQAARTVLPSEVYDYYATGAGDEVASGEAETAWLSYRTLPRVLRDVSATSVSVSVLGTTLGTPVMVAPTAFQGLAHPDGECATARGAGAAGALTVLSMRSSRLIEDVARAATGPWWFQTYLLRDRGLTAAVVARAAAAGASALVLTGDTPYVASKPRLLGTRFAVPAEHFLINLERHLMPGADVDWASEQSPAATLADVEWLSAASGLPVLVKGVLRGDDAKACLGAGAAGVIVSNHGGRQSSRALATAEAFPGVVDAVQGRAPVLVDGGIRSGADVLVAIALGAAAVLVGRPVLWALAAGGAEGVRSALMALTEDLKSEMSLAGACNVSGLDLTLLRRRGAVGQT